MMLDMEAALTLLRKHGVKSFSQVDEKQWSVELFPPQHVAQIDTTPDLPLHKLFGDEDGSGKCNCGHSMTEHGGHGLCLLGCGAEQCMKDVPETP